MKIGICIAGEHFLLDGIQERELSKYRVFLASIKEEGIRIVFREEDIKQFTEEINGKYVGGKAFFAYRNFSIEVDPQQREAIVAGRYSPYLVENALRVLTSYMLSLKQRGFLLHAAAIEDEGAYLFYGKSGSGKSTWARMHAKKQVLSDEIVAVYRDESNNFVCSSTPFWGEFQSCPVNISAQIQRGLHLRRRGKFHLSRYSVGDALFSLLPCVISYGQDITSPLLEMVEYFARQVPCYAFSFDKKQADFESIKVENVVHF